MIIISNKTMKKNKNTKTVMIKLPITREVRSDSTDLIKANFKTLLIDGSF